MQQSIVTLFQRSTLNTQQKIGCQLSWIKQLQIDGHNSQVLVTLNHLAKSSEFLRASSFWLLYHEKVTEECEYCYVNKEYVSPRINTDTTTVSCYAPEKYQDIIAQDSHRYPENVKQDVMLYVLDC